MNYEERTKQSIEFFDKAITKMEKNGGPDDLPKEEIATLSRLYHFRNHALSMLRKEEKDK